MPPPKQLIGSFLLFLVVFVTLTVTPALWPGFREGYAVAYRGGVNLLFGTFGSQGRVRLGPLPVPDPEHDTEVVLENRLTMGMKRIAGDTGLQGYRPTALLIALTLATPIPWRRRWRALVWGFLLINAFIAVRMLVFLLWEFSGTGGPAFIELGPLLKSVLEGIKWMLVESYAGCYIVPIPLWFLVTLWVAKRRGDRADDAGA